MKIKILLEDKSNLEIEIELSEDIEDLKYLIDDEIEEKEKSINYYQMVYDNIILNDKKKNIKFYNFLENKVVKIGKLENFLSEGDVIVELIIQSGLEPLGYLVHLIVNQNSSVSNIKSTIKDLISHEIELFAMKGNQLGNDENINDYELNGYFRFFIVPSADSKNFNDYCKNYDRFLVENYLRNNDLTYLWYRNEFNECRVEGLKEILHSAKLFIDNYIIITIFRESISLNNAKSILGENFPLKSSFMNCRFLFCDVMTNQICDICDDFYWRQRIDNNYDDVVVSVFRQYFRDAVRIEIIENVKAKYRSSDNKSWKSIVIDALDYCLKYLAYPTKDWRHLIRSFFGEFAFRSVKDSEFEGLIKKWGEDHSNIIIPYETTCRLPTAMAT